MIPDGTAIQTVQPCPECGRSLTDSGIPNTEGFCSATKNCRGEGAKVVYIRWSTIVSEINHEIISRADLLRRGGF